MPLMWWCGQAEASGQGVSKRQQAPHPFSLEQFTFLCFFPHHQELIHQSFMHAADLRFELAWKRQLECLRTTLLASTVQQPSASSAAGVVMSSKTGPVVVRSTGDAATALLSSACDNHIRCPAHPLKSEASATASCVDEITPYYLVS